MGKDGDPQDHFVLFDHAGDRLLDHSRLRREQAEHERDEVEDSPRDQVQRAAIKRASQRRVECSMNCREAEHGGLPTRLA